MELTEFARNILFSCSLSEKLADPGSLTDILPTPGLILPSKPARDAKLSLDRWQRSAKVAFPSRADLVNREQIGILLHFFANHELLALELMALALLKFPDAPTAFRMGIAHTMRDEQRHLCSYLGRMAEFGVEFGDIPLNDFFWSQCSSMQTPLDYVCRMSLTFEQANLDFAAYFRDVLSELGDKPTADLLDQVLRDEMRHVKHGLNWFRRWKTDSDSDWQAFCQALGAEINPSRAKGSLFRDDLRRELGLSEDYIHSLHVYSQSKGRPPRGMFYNPEAEEDVRLGGAQSPALSATIQAARNDLAPVMLYLATQADLVLVPRELPTRFLVELRNVGLQLPEFLPVELSEKSILTALRSRKLSGLLPWSVSPATRRLESELELLPASGCFEGTAENLRDVHSKAFALELLREFLNENAHDKRLVEPAHLGRVVADSDAFADLMSQWSGDFDEQTFVAKRPWSASGRHRVFGKVNAGGLDAQPAQIRGWFEKSWRLAETPIVQPYFQRVLDVSIQCRIDVVDGHPKIHVIGMTRVLNTQTGQYAGTSVGRFLSNLDGKLVRFFHQPQPGPDGDPENVEELMNRMARWTGARLFERGLRGPFGLDAFIYSSKDGSFKLYPMIEINPRHTMGRVALTLSRRMLPGRIGLWLHIPKSWLAKLGVDSFTELRHSWQQKMPLQIYSKSGGVLISAGLLETTPAEQCEHVWTCFLVAQELNRELGVLGVADLLALSVPDSITDTLEKPL